MFSKWICLDVYNNQTFPRFPILSDENDLAFIAVDKSVITINIVFSQKVYVVCKSLEVPVRIASDEYQQSIFSYQAI